MGISARRCMSRLSLRAAFALSLGYVAFWNIFTITPSPSPPSLVGHEPQRVALISQKENVQPQHRQQQNRQNRRTESFAACLLVMDDNHFLIEWLAYHYHVLPLRNLIVAVDPRSQTSPQSILERWQDKTDLNVTVWWKDSDYITNHTELEEAESWVAIKFQDDHPSGELIRHRARQRLFYFHCLQEHKRQERTYTLLTDTDEYLTINYETVNNTKSSIVASKLIPSISEPGSVLKLIQHEQKYHATNSSVVSSPCIQIPRSRFGVVEDDTTTIIAQNSPESQLLTMRWRYHAAPDNYAQNRISKTVIDVSRIHNRDLRPVDSIHRPLRQYCGRRKLHIRAPDQLLLLHHYLGTWEQYNFRRDARQGNERSRKVRALFDELIFFAFTSWEQTKNLTKKIISLNRVGKRCLKRLPN